jgi:hypothetical protein
MPQWSLYVRSWGAGAKRKLYARIELFRFWTQLRHSATLRAPHECADTYYLMSGRKVSVPPDRLVAMTVEDSKPGWTTQNNLEIRQTELMASRPIHD